MPCLLIYGFGVTLLIRAAFGSNRLLAVDALFILGVAFTVLAATYLAVQYMLALKRTWFLLPLGAVAVAEPILLLQASKEPKGFAMVVLGVQIVGRADRVRDGAATRQGPAQPRRSAAARPRRARARGRLGPLVVATREDHRAGRQLRDQLRRRVKAALAEAQA